MPPLHGRVAIVTGGSREIGAAIAEALAGAGAAVVSAHWEAATPTRRCGTPEDAANALLYLVSPAARMVNGHTLLIGGGWTNVGRVPDAPI